MRGPQSVKHRWKEEEEGDGRIGKEKETIQLNRPMPHVDGSTKERVELEWSESSHPAEIHKQCRLCWWECPSPVKYKDRECVQG